jgi:hypothetical protein
VASPSVTDNRERQPLRFFVQGAGALVALFVLTFALEPRPEVNGVRALILFGLGLVALKVVLRHYNIDFPPRRHRDSGPPK